MLVENRERIGLAVDDNRILDLNLAYASCLAEQGERKACQLADVLIPCDMIGFIDGGRSALDAARKAEQFAKNLKQPRGPNGERLVYGKDEVRIKAPIEHPQSFFAATVTNKIEWNKAIKPPNPHPTYFIKLHSCITGPYDPVEVPDIGVVGSEVEVAAVIGKRGKNIPLKEVDDYVFGYTIHNDITAHELRRTSEWIAVKTLEGMPDEKLTYQGRYKCFDTFAPMGPWLVTRDEIGDIYARALKMTARVNGQLVQSGTTADTVYPFPMLIHYLSQAHTLEVGDLVSGGTVQAAPGWTASKIDLRRLGGVLESEIEGLGVMRNPIKPI